MREYISAEGSRSPGIFSPSRFLPGARLVPSAPGNSDPESHPLGAHPRISAPRFRPRGPPIGQGRSSFHILVGPGETVLHTYALMLYIYTSAVAPTASRAFAFVRERLMKYQRHNAIRELVADSPVGNQDELRRKLRRRGFAVTQATLSRDIHELRLSKGPSGYSLPNGIGAGPAVENNSPPALAEMLESFGLRVQQAMNQVVVGTVMGGAQPVAAALDHEGWADVVGTVAGDDTVLVICPDVRRAADVESRLRTMLES